MVINKILQKVEKEQEKRILLESTELDAQGEEGKEWWKILKLYLW